MAQSLRQPPRSKYNRVARALPFKASADACQWLETRTPQGRRILVPKP